MPTFGREVKPFVLLHVADLRHVKEPYNLPWKSQVIGKISRQWQPSTQCTRAIPVALTGLWFSAKPAQRLNTTTNNNNEYYPCVITMTYTLPQNKMHVVTETFSTDH
jgi:hypothetical protein